MILRYPGRLALMLIMPALILLLLSGPCDAHRMILGYKVSELQLKAMYDDGTPAGGVKIVVQEDGHASPVQNLTTDDSGVALFHPVDDLGRYNFTSTAAGHRAELKIGRELKGEDAEIPLAARAAAGLGYLLGAAGLSMIYVARKRGK
ncbi:MAG: hypothetical protein A4E48_00978 [Methanosaeta sp. PtaU1.Bin060]|nr:MAG: hypothetical protein A4E48_00978 [Methanosaeta sp. PtaU1.Bin060]